MQILEGLNPEQCEATKTLDGPLLILAGAGSGKTRVLTHRIAYMIQEGINPYNILAVTFTNKAANEMKERVENLLEQKGDGLWIGTFHSMCVRILRRELDKLGYNKNFVIYDTSDQLTVIKDAMKQLNIDTKQFNPRAIRAKISSAKNELITPEEYRDSVGGFFEEIVAKVFELYQKLLKSSNALDFDDLIMLTVKLLRKFALVRAYYQNKFKYILVDEYQDTNHAQYVLVHLLAEKYRNLCVVGDPDQSIYGFRGADIRNILKFEEDYPEAKVIKLEQNYRSTERILDAAHHVIVKNEDRKEKRLWTANGEGAHLGFFQAVSDREETQYLITEILKLRQQDGYDYSDFAVLYRINAQSRILEDAFLRNRIPYKIVGGLRFYDRKEIKDIIAYLRLIYNPADDVSFARIVNRPKRGIGATSLDRLSVYAAENGVSLYEAASKVKEILTIRGRAKNELLFFYEMLEGLRSLIEDLSVTELTKKVLDETGYLEELELQGTVEARTRIENIQELFSAMQQFIKSGQGYTLAAYLEEVSLISELDNVDESDDAVLLMTLHTVKGLEFPVVFITGMEENIFPYVRALEEGGGLEEERRLCYVGITRAKKQLYLTCATQRMVFGQLKLNPCSRYIDDIPTELFGQSRAEDKPADEQTFADTAQQGTGRTAPINEFTQYFGGERVKHPKWGTGTVVGVKGEGENQELDIVFPAPTGLKKVLLCYAPLERV